MNEEYAADPGACESALELTHLLREFGPYAGRYLVKFPGKWLAKVHAHIEAMPDGLEKMRAKRALEKVKAEGGLVPSGGRNWVDGARWLENAERVQSGKAPFSGVVVRRSDAGKYPCIDDFDPAPSGDAFVPGTARELAKVAEKLLTLGPAAHLIDPYFNPCRSSNWSVLAEFLAIAQKGEATWTFDLWSLSKKVLERNTKEDLRRALTRAAEAAGYVGRALRMNLIEDKVLSSGEELFRFHARYLLTRRGALRYDTGFQEDRKGKRVEVSVVGRGSHEQLMRIFLESDLASSIRDVVTVAT